MNPTHNKSLLPAFQHISNNPRDSFFPSVTLASLGRHVPGKIWAETPGCHPGQMEEAHPPSTLQKSPHPDDQKMF